MILNFARRLPPTLTSARQTLVNVLGSSARLAYLATDYRNGDVLSGVTLPAAPTAVELDLDGLPVPDYGETLLEEAVGYLRSTEAQSYVSAMADDLVSPVKGRRLVAVCALICFLCRE